ncbi:UNVERIFIED_CONTAM: hypothetical protein Sangu_0782000 [Sesamum angustifolium]|uniref:Uncharacterized protein n=1 Tax=Sesamum angustifolium TaxID=2727405 RepID=A0AAW2PU73_9LAMI
MSGIQRYRWWPVIRSNGGGKLERRWQQNVGETGAISGGSNGRCRRVGRRILMVVRLVGKAPESFPKAGEKAQRRDYGCPNDGLFSGGVVRLHEEGFGGG